MLIAILSSHLLVTRRSWGRFYSHFITPDNLRLHPQFEAEEIAQNRSAPLGNCRGVREKKTIRKTGASVKDFSNESIVKMIVGLHLAGCSIKSTAKILKISEQKVRKILITFDLFESEKSRYIAKRINEGASVEDVAREIETTERYVNSYLPYSKGVYYGDHPSKGALVLREWRAKRRQATVARN